MVALKRPATATTLPGKKPRRVKTPAKLFAVEVRQKCRVVSKALEDSDHLPASVANLLAGMVPDSLGIVKDQREACQTTCVTMVGEGLQRMEKAFEDAVSAAQAKLAGVDDDRAARTKAKLETETET